MNCFSSRRLIVTGIVATLLFSSYTGGEATNMNSFRWMIGTWETPRKSGIMRETWKVANDSSFDGVSVMVNTQGDIRLLEQMELIRRDGRYFFTSVAPGENDGKRISFRIEDYSDKHFEAVNLQHDFPKRIMYRFSGPDSLFARIDGGPSAPEQKVDFHFKRKE
jgi:hypothetical protein